MSGPRSLPAAASRVALLPAAVPALVGQSLYWQAIVVGPARLTSLERTPFTDLQEVSPWIR